MLTVELVKSLVELTGETRVEEVVRDALDDVDGVADVSTELDVNRLDVKGADEVSTELEVKRLEVITTTLLVVAADEDEEEVATEADDEPHDQPDEDDG